jgi:hypothetical protein
LWASGFCTPPLQHYDFARCNPFRLAEAIDGPKSHTFVPVLIFCCTHRGGGRTRTEVMRGQLRAAPPSPKQAAYSASISETSSWVSLANSFSLARFESRPPFWRRKPNRLLSARSGISMRSSIPARNRSKFYRKHASFGRSSSMVLRTQAYRNSACGVASKKR